jgi:glucans biosynthesis protein C
MPESRRMHFLDNLRAFVVLLVVALHGFLTYMAYAPSWYVVDSENSVFFTLLVLLMEVPLMPIMFFIAGYFALPSLRKRAGSAFLRAKLVRLGIPWFVGVLVLAPLIGYLKYISRDVPMGLIEFWRTDFWGERYGQSTYWFLGVLLFMFLVLSLVYSLSSHLRTVKQRVSIPSWKTFVSFAAVTLAGFLLLNLWFSIDEWMTVYYLISFQPVRLPLYIGYFVLGLYAYQHAWFTADGYQPRAGPWGLGCILSGLAYLGFRVWSLTSDEPVLLVEVGTGILFNALCLASLIAGVAVFQRKVNGAGFFWKSQAANSYGIYYLHPLVLDPLAYDLLKVSLPAFLKAILLVLPAIVLSWGLSALVLRKVCILPEILSKVVYEKFLRRRLGERRYATTEALYQRSLKIYDLKLGPHHQGHPRDVKSRS